MSDICACGHPVDAHDHIPGVRFERPVWVSDNGGPSYRQEGLPDVWVCTGVRPADVNDPDYSPWDSVCGCVLHRDPSGDGGERLAA